ncbi:MAG: M28 family peptidase, partial [Planctomycetes bacterium]|nr:M28 family peptidase [Planctomycetota bacterium]
MNGRHSLNAKGHHRRRRILLALIIIALVFLTGWWTMIRMPGNSYQGPLPAADAGLIAMSAELRRHVSYLSENIGERNVLSRPRELAATAEYIEQQFAGGGYRVGRQEYEADGTLCCNLEIAKIGTRLPGEIVVIGAHYDSVLGCPAANDNGSGVAALLRLARTFADQETDRTLRFVAFVNEEPPYFQTSRMGSWDGSGGSPSSGM